MEWFYEHNGQQMGPVSRAEIIRLIVQHRIKPHTLVWTPDFGDQWRPASKAGLITPSFSVMVSSASRVKPPLGEKKDPATVPSHWAWLMMLPSFLEIFIFIIDIVRGVDPMQRSGSILETICFAGITFIAMWYDRKTLAEHGYKPPSLWWWLLLIGYFWVRYSILKRGLILAVMPLVLLFIGMGLGAYSSKMLKDFPAYHLRKEQVQTNTNNKTPNFAEKKQPGKSPSQKGQNDSPLKDGDNFTSDSAEIQL
ncbi:DUF4339 domain-containing protein [Aristophania vespae]|uniref:DUF4339 domain-containing protein n=1 Tax=Aristophania vespae TaxID=2697033 RepID=UPI00235190A3|nr:DUF4339 domain-containing protein [Aristophania vespae]UMM63604.1 hypothetical protein DM15PD_05780 [Aristophania vespae]